MNHLDTFLLALTVTFEAVLCVTAFGNGLQKVLPLFSAYIAVLLIGSLGLWFVYHWFGFESIAGYFYYWSSLMLNATMRSFAIAELCRYKLRAYRGVWALTWRLLLGLTVIFLLHAAYHAWGQPNRLAIYSMTLDRDLDVASVAILGALLLIHNYYELSLESFQKILAIGICLICAVDIIGDTIIVRIYAGYLLPFFSANKGPFWATLKQYYDHLMGIWDTVHLFSFMAALSIWCYAVRKPIPAPSPSPALLPAEIYRELSPAINVRLNAFNNRLMELLKS